MTKEKKIFFNSEADRNLWIKLNAELIQYFRKKVNHKDEELGSLNKPFSCLWVSKNQLKYDEYERDAPRFSLEQLLTIDFDELIKITRQRHKNWFKENFPNTNNDQIPTL